MSTFLHPPWAPACDESAQAGDIPTPLLPLQPAVIFSQRLREGGTVRSSPAVMLPPALHPLRVSICEFVSESMTI